MTDRHARTRTPSCELITKEWLPVRLGSPWGGSGEMGARLSPSVEWPMAFLTKYPSLLSPVSWGGNINLGCLVWARISPSVVAQCGRQCCVSPVGAQQTSLRLTFGRIHGLYESHPFAGDN